MADWQPVQAKDEKGGFVRQTSSFRNWVTPDGSPGPTGKGGFKAEPGLGLTHPDRPQAQEAQEVISVHQSVVRTIELGFGEGWPAAITTPTAMTSYRPKRDG